MQFDLGVRGEWQPQVKVLCLTYKLLMQMPHSTVIVHLDLFLNQQLKKKRIYRQAFEEHIGTFIPLVTAIDGLLHREAEHFLKRMATCIKSKW